MAKANIVYGAEGLFKIERTDKSGKVKSDPINGNKMLDTAACVRLVVGAVKGQQTMSDAWQSLIVNIFGRIPADTYKGKGDRTTGKTPTTFKDAIRKAEDAYFDQLAFDKVTGIPQDEGKRNEMVKTIRNDNNYSNIRSVCAKYYAFVGAMPATDAGYLIPRPVMQAHIASVLNVTPEDSSVAGRINALIVETREATDDKALREALVACQALAQQLKARLDHVAELATNARSGGASSTESVADAAKNALGKMKRAPVPNTDDTHVVA